MEVDNIQALFIREVLLTACSAAGPFLSPENTAVNNSPPQKKFLFSWDLYFEGDSG